MTHGLRHRFDRDRAADRYRMAEQRERPVDLERAEHIAAELPEERGEQQRRARHQRVDVGVEPPAVDALQQPVRIAEQPPGEALDRMEDPAAPHQHDAEHGQRQRQQQRDADRAAAHRVRHREQQHEAQRGKRVLDDDRHQHLDDHRSRHATRIGDLPAREPDPDEFAADPDDRQQPVHGLAHGRDPPQKRQRAAPVEQHVPCVRIEQQRQRVERHEPQQRVAGTREHLRHVADALVQPQREQDADADRPAEPFEPFAHDGWAPGLRAAGAPRCASRVPNTAAKPPVATPARASAAATRGDSSASSSSAGR
ncbi:hypothetical protein FEP76_05640 [Burkholderia multivorans]|nr:hypothetical protein [Burkholderia multivorans]